jgi:hypothetical protein
MTNDKQPNEQHSSQEQQPALTAYETPQLERLGTIEDLTQSTPLPGPGDSLANNLNS